MAVKKKKKKNATALNYTLRRLFKTQNNNQLQIPKKRRIIYKSTSNKKKYEKEEKRRTGEDLFFFLRCKKRHRCRMDAEEKEREKHLASLLYWKETYTGMERQEEKLKSDSEILSCQRVNINWSIHK